MLIAISIAGLSMYWLAQEEISELFDYQLKQVALSIQVQKDVITLESTDKELEKDNVIQVWNDQSVLIYNPKPSRALPRYNLLGLETVFYRNKAWRIFILQRNAQHIQVAQPIEERNEFALLLALLDPPGRIMPLSLLEEKLYSWDHEIASNAIEVLIHRLRKKIGTGFIQNVRGVGYRVSAP